MPDLVTVYRGFFEIMFFCRLLHVFHQLGDYLFAFTLQEQHGMIDVLAVGLL